MCTTALRFCLLNSPQKTFSKLSRCEIIIILSYFFPLELSTHQPEVLISQVHLPFTLFVRKHFEFLHYFQILCSCYTMQIVFVVVDWRESTSTNCTICTISVFFSKSNFILQQATHYIASHRMTLHYIICNQHKLEFTFQGSL